jgi:hypothetical protein
MISILKKRVILPLIRKGCRKAEIRPKEPDSGNADVGSVSDFINLFYPLSILSLTI